MLHNSLKKSYIGFIVLITLVLLSGCISKKQNDIHHKELKSGTRFIVKMIPSKDPKTGKKKIIDNETIQSVKKVLFSRIRESGIESISIKKQEDEKLLITIPRESDTEMVRYLIEKVGSFQIRQQVATKKGKPIKWKTVMNKSAIKKATFERIKSRPVINVVLKDSFKKKFAEITLLEFFLTVI
ncbi:MAG: hypothetical protein K8T10_14055 [Candidatus Eremiobacteraeota bacterium]|nr:hypothetical protein [Candidatus Eremiobacteraeota bacterium]